MAPTQSDTGIFQLVWLPAVFSRFWSMSDSSSTCWHVLGLLQWGLIYSHPFLCIFNVLSNKTALVFSSKLWFTWIPLKTAAQHLFIRSQYCQREPCFPLQLLFFFPTASCIVCFPTFLLSFTSAHIKIKIPRPNASFSFPHNMLRFKIFWIELELSVGVGMGAGREGEDEGAGKEQWWLSPFSFSIFLSFFLLLYHGICIKAKWDIHDLFTHLFICSDIYCARQWS